MTWEFLPLIQTCELQTIQVKKILNENPIQLTKILQFVTTLLGTTFLRRCFLLIVLALTCGSLALAPAARAVDPPPDGTCANGNTAEGQDALFSLTSDGFFNTATGFDSLYHNTAGNENTATGDRTLFQNTTGVFNTATGASALGFNTSGQYNTATGSLSLYNNTSGQFNTATGGLALNENTIGSHNTATGLNALNHNTTASSNTATGYSALFQNTIGADNTARGANALLDNTTGSRNGGESWGQSVNLAHFSSAARKAADTSGATPAFQQRLTRLTCLSLSC